MMRNLFSATKIIIKEAKKRGIKVEILLSRKNFIQLSKNSKSIYIKHTKMPINSSISMFIAMDKELTNLVLERNQLPTPKHYNCFNLDEINKNLKIISSPYVLKAPNLSWGKDIYTNISNKNQLLNIAQMMLNKYDEVILEQHIYGYDYRVLVIDGRFFSAVRRTPAQVIGDGKCSLKELINIENKNPLRGDEGISPLVKLEVDKHMLDFLYINKININDVPKKNQVIVLRGVANQSQGGSVSLVTSLVHQDYQKIAEKAANSIGLKFAGIDIISQDISKSFKETQGYIIEVNNSPDFYMNQHPAIGKGDNVGEAVINMLEKYCFK